MALLVGSVGHGRGGSSIRCAARATTKNSTHCSTRPSQRLAIAWDQRLERWLLDHKVKAIDAENEAERFGFGLEAQFEPIERRCGSGYFNSVLVGYLHESGFAEQATVREKLGA